ncbi:hypothetical protein UABHE_005490 [Candidatus Uabimicrobium helgolandensis]
MLQELKQHGIVIENTQKTCLWHQTAHAVVGKDLSKYSICVIGKDSYLSLVFDHLQLIGITNFVTEPADANLTILCEPGLKPSFIEKWDRENVVPWLRMSWTTSYGEVGPLFIPKQTACYQCFQKRLLSNRRFRDSYQNYSEIIEKRGIPLNLFAPSFLWCLSHILLEVASYTTNYTPPQLCGRLLYRDSSEQFLEQVLQVPGCSGNCS